MAKCFEASLECRVSVERAWRALGEFDLWLTRLSTVKAVERTTAGPLLALGSTWKVIPEIGPAGRAQITEVRPFERIHTSVSFGPLRSELDIEVRAMGQVCELRRRQQYPGIIGYVFATVARRREALETHQYLQTWARYAEELHD